MPRRSPPCWKGVSGIPIPFWMHKGKNGNVLVRVFDPMADSVAILYGEDDLSYQAMEKVQKDGLFAAEFESGEFFRYQVRKTFPNGTTFTARDPYSFLPAIGEMDLYLFNAGENRRVYDCMGAHFRTIDGTDGVVFIRLGAQCGAGFRGGKLQLLGRAPRADASDGLLRNLGAVCARAPAGRNLQV